MGLTPEQQRIVAELLDEGTKLRRFRKLDYYQPYPKQREFHALGATHRERGLIAANRVGKSECAAAETAMHLTGEYPEWWPGKRFTKPIRAWAAGEDGELVRDVIQAKLCGTPGVTDDYGTGFIPKSALVDVSLARGTTDLYDTIQVRHKAGGVSTLTLKTYGEGRRGFQAATLDWLWFDEEPPEDIYSEGMTRLATTGGHLLATFTPLQGKTNLVRRFKDEPGPERAAIQMGIYDAGHFTKEMADALVAGYPAHEREARAYGVPQMGEGRIFLTDENVLKVPPQEVPHYWFKIGGLDFGGQGERSHPFAYVLLAIDRENDIVYLVHSIRLRGVTKLQHVPAIRAIAADVPVAWPHDGNERRDGTTVADQYRSPMPGMPGLNMLPKHATWPDGGFSTWAAVNELDDRCKTDRFKVFDTPANAMFFEEYRQFHQELDKTGQPKIVAIDDDILSAVFKGLMMKRAAKAVQVGPKRERFAPKPTADEWAPKKPAAQDFDPWTGRAIDTASRL